MELEKKIHDALISHVGGNAKDVKGISGTQLTKMKQGKSGISTKKLKEVLKENGMIGKLELDSNGLKIIINLF